MIARCLKEIDIYGILKLSVHAGHQRQKGPGFGCLIQAASIKFKLL